MKTWGCTLALVAVVAAAACAPAGLITSRDYNRFALRAQEEGLWREAEYRLRQALRENPGDARLHNNLAVALEALGELDEAHAEYRTAVKLDPGNDTYRRNLRDFTTAHSWEYGPEDEEAEAEEEVPGDEER
ncbi:MAG TPA: tetratricopeptide repeat protein [bacterium]|nr:tetratricopeptide repeat protein [bacterium]